MNNSVNVSSMDTIPKKEKFLIAFNKFKKITFFGACKVEINTADKCLIFRTNSSDKGFQELASTFRRIFVQKENALCIIDATTNNDFLIIFPSKSTCDTVYSAINKVKFPFGNPPTSDPIMDDYLFKNNFYIPILKEIQLKITGYLEIKTIILDLVNTFEVGQRQIYMNMIFEELIFSTSDNDSSMINNSDTVTIEDEDTNVGVENDDTFNDTVISSVDQSLNEATTTNSSYSFRKRSIVDYTSKRPTAPKKSKVSSTKSSVVENQMLDVTCSSNDNMVSIVKTKNSESRIIQSPDFQLLQRQYGSRRCTKLIVFDTNDRSLCQEYSVYQSSINKYRCYDCKTKFNHHVGAKLIKNKDGVDVVQLGAAEHLCKPKKFDHEEPKKEAAPKSAPKESRIIQKPNFKNEMVPHKFKSGETVKRLTICDPDYGNQNFLYHFHVAHQHFYCNNCMKKGKYVSAKLMDREECIQLSAVEHVCQ